MKKILCLIIFLIPVFAYAEQCADIEYAELKDMNRESFDQEYCKVTLLYESNINYWTESEFSKVAERDMKSCEILSDKMKRVYQARFKDDPKNCTKKRQEKKTREVWPDRIEE